MGQKKYKVKLNNTKFTTTFVYSITSEIESNYTIKIVSIREKKILKKTNVKKVIGTKYFKIDLTHLKKGKYNFIVTRENSKSNFKQKITKE